MKTKLLAALLAEPMLLEPMWLKAMLTAIHEGKDFSKPERNLQALQLIDGDIAQGRYYTTYRDNIAIIAINGPIFPTPNFFTEWLGIGTALDRFAKDLVAAVEDDHHIDTVLLLTETPGGSISAVNTTSKLIADLGKEKTIISYTGDVNASAGYWLSSSASKMYADPVARIGSIGVVHTVANPDYGKGEGKEPYSIEIVNTSSPNKRPNPNTKEGKAEIVRLLDSIASVFIGTVAENRNITMAKVESDFGKGGLLIGKDALDAGMIDALDTFEGVIEKHSTEDASTTKKYTTKDVKGDSMKLSVEELKAKYSDTYQAVADEVTKPLQVTIDKKDTTIKGLEDQVVTLEATGEKRDKAITTLTASVSALEVKNTEAAAKKEAMEAEAKLKGTADALIQEKLDAASLPDRIVKKLRPTLDHNAFVNAEGVLDVVAFGKKIDAEITDWKDIAGETAKPILGGIPRQPSQENNDNDDIESTESSDRMFALAGGVVTE